MSARHLLVLYPHRLLLQEPIVDRSGSVIGGWVVNGAWYYRTNGETDFAFYEEDDFLDPVTAFPADAQTVVVVPDIYGAYEYNAPINWADTQPRLNLADPLQLQAYVEACDMAEIEALNTKRKPSGFDDFDDDVPF